jgi:hypothetical protein
MWRVRPLHAKEETSMMKNLAAWDVREEDFPSRGSMYDKLKFVLRYAVLAPSGPNTQPWKFSIKDSSISVIFDRSRTLPAVDPTHRTAYMSLGCAVANMLIAAEHFNLGYSVECFPDGIDADRIAVIGFSEGIAERRFPDLFRQITERHTNRSRFEEREIEPEKLQRMKELVENDGFRLDIMTDPDGKNRMAEILARAHKIQLGNKEFRRELASWIRPNTSDAYDGLPGYAFGYSDFESYLGKFIFGAFDTSWSRARKESALMRESPAAAVLSSDSEDKLTWVRLGVTFEKLFLLATEMDVRFDLFSQPVAIDELRGEMAEFLGVRYPQLLIRMGYAPPTRHTPRRPVELVLVE